MHRQVHISINKLNKLFLASKPQGLYVKLGEGTDCEQVAGNALIEGERDEPLLHQADLSCREEKTAAASSDPEEWKASPNPLALRVQKGRGSRCALGSEVKRRTQRRLGEAGKKQARRRRAGDIPTTTEKEEEASWRQTANSKDCPRSPWHGRRPAQTLATLEGKRGHFRCVTILNWRGGRESEDSTETRKSPVIVLVLL
ncbi:hypothetical protein NDU88_001677 [Pleurodeles waltl]|uniref:Uncharacterized protein n=1 Tax=Pleurodeles waltl TaxID=8319 RepID=A0AAV7P7X1_PLEWA|nr:hypothetical protein NDU88_001677 [Pleurodeles waltl]